MENQQKFLQQGVLELASLARPKDSSVRGIDLMRVDQCEKIGINQVPALFGPAPTVGVSTEQEAKVDEAPPVKRKRGRPPKTQAKTSLQPQPPPPPPGKDDKEEDVCFICFDGGDLVLCDRRNCPKAYHPACIKRDEAFFQTTAKWNCGWHICGTCKKASSYMCYTCTFSVCKRCFKDADYVIVRGNMGLCGTCIKPIMLIENISQGDNEAIKVDFDDKLSWEYLFKVYWLSLKEDLSLTVDELTRANNPWKEVPNAAPKVKSRNDNTHNKAYSSDNSAVDVAVNGTRRRRRTSDSPTLPNKSDATNPSNILKKLPGDTNWATKELLEFVSFMKNGDTSVHSQFDVQRLLFDYIKEKNLRDPLQKTQINCDMMLVKLLGKQQVGHFEMLKLLEPHFFIQEKPKDEKITNGKTTHAVPSQIEEDSVHDSTVRDRRRKIRRKTDGRVQNENLDAYAAIDVHNINLIYLRRKFLETLLDDINKVHEKVVGTILRIKDQKLDIHRLVQVVGTCKSITSYQLGAKTTDVMLEILNLDKREVISIDQLSDQNVTEDECKRLCQSIKCGLYKRLTVGDILKIAATLQTMRINEALEAEVLQLSHLHDRASEKGHIKELRECVEKIVLLESPEERQRLLQEIPEVHTDPSMDPSLDTRKQDDEESEIWQYSDPTGKTQGPFSMVQLRRWKSSGHFPPYLRIWRTYEKQEESILLTKALTGQFDKSTTLSSSSFLPQVLKPSPHNSRRTGMNQVETPVSRSVKVEGVPWSISVVPGHVRETPRTDQSRAVQVDCNRTAGGSVYAPNLNQEINFLDFPGFTPKLSSKDMEAQAAETIQSLSSCGLVKDSSGFTWNATTDAATTTSNVVVTGGQLPQVTQPLVKLVNLQSSDNTQVANSSGWPAIVTDPNEYDESVSDLLAEVEAMEQNGLPSSPTSTFHCNDDGPEAKDNTLFSHCGTTGPELLLFAPSTSVNHDLTLTTTALRLGSVERLSGVGLEPSPHDSTRGNTSPRGSHQQKRSGGDSRDRQWWNNGHSNQRYEHGSGSNVAHLSKGLKICKFYENGYCKNGASCSFWHP